jgi:hypothetical protein
MSSQLRWQPSSIDMVGTGRVSAGRSASKSSSRTRASRRQRTASRRARGRCDHRKAAARGHGGGARGNARGAQHSLRTGQQSRGALRRSALTAAGRARSFAQRRWQGLPDPAFPLELDGGGLSVSKLLATGSVATNRTPLNFVGYDK